MIYSVAVQTESVYETSLTPLMGHLAPHIRGVLRKASIQGPGRGFWDCGLQNHTSGRLVLALGGEWLRGDQFGLGHRWTRRLDQ
jgi:hypothetical protein